MVVVSRRSTHQALLWRGAWSCCDEEYEHKKLSAQKLNFRCVQILKIGSSNFLPESFFMKNEHITRLSFCGVRRLNTFSTSSSNEMFQEWIEKRKWYNFREINIFIGVNGGGKSTILELIDFLRDPDRLISLPRENKKNNYLTAFEINVGNETKVRGISHPHSIRKFPDAPNVGEGIHNAQSLELLAKKEGKILFSFRKNISKSNLDPESHAQLKEYLVSLKCHVAYWPNNQEANVTDLVNILNKAVSHLPGVISPEFVPKNSFEEEFAWSYKKCNPFQAHDKQRVGIWLSDDITQQNHVHISALPSGWQRFVSILSWLEKVPDGSVCLLEEPETHLHPRLQRYLAKQIDKIADKKSLQLFISTHSTVFQQSNLWEKPPVIFSATAEVIEEYSSAWHLLEALGIRGSDISQSNGVIWIEGPSDRIYIKHWLNLYCKKYGKNEYKENVDYSFNFYGGAVLSHMSLSEQKSFVSMLSINRNMMLVMDRDNDFEETLHGKLHCIKRNSAKARIIKEMSSGKQEIYKIWITDKYTIESYLPANFIKKYFTEKESGQLVPLDSAKIAISMDYTEMYPDFEGCSNMPEQLLRHIEGLFNSIEKWNS
jgi:energy-coupling factor transporter ATP-binding protein EcfA2